MKHTLTAALLLILTIACKQEGSQTVKNADQVNTKKENTMKKVHITYSKIKG